jgi:hypothetical protein
MTPLELFECEQGSGLWASARCGKVTASRCFDMAGKNQNGDEAARRRDYRNELMVEILTGRPVVQRVTREMQWGIDQEPFARAAYEMARDVLVQTCGFVVHDDIERFGCSPDGLVGHDGMLQIKCPKTTTHLAWMLSGTIPIEHMPQMLGELSCTGRTWCDFMSFDPRLPKHLQTYIRRFQRDEKLIFTLESEVVHFNNEIDALLRKLPQGEPQPIVNIAEEQREDEVEF